jgi:hypothetical protein
MAEIISLRSLAASISGRESRKLENLDPALCFVAN